MRSCRRHCAGPQGRTEIIRQVARTDPAPPGCRREIVTAGMLGSHSGARWTQTPMKKEAPTDHPVHALVSGRWSPYWFDDREVAPDDLRSILEAARWAPSSYNEQPWSYLVATRNQPEPFGRMIECLVEGNRTWAASAAVLMIGIIARNHARNGAPNRACEHDLGLAAATLTFEASARGISVHQMSGILPEQVHDTYGVPDTHTPLTAIALGYCAPPDQLPERYCDRQHRARERRALDEFVFAGRWGEPAPVVAGES